MQCPNSVILLFPKEIYSSVGSSVVLPQLLEVIPAEKLVCVQFLRNGAVRLTFKQQRDCEELILRGVTFGDVPLRILSADAQSRLVYLRDCPVEVPDEVVQQFFSSFGQVHSVQKSRHAVFPDLSDGNRIIKMSLDKDVPPAVSVSGFECRVWYVRQPPQCSICRNIGHRNRNCPLSGLCRRCRQPGHKARECVQAWGSTRSSAPVPDDTPVADADAPVPGDTPVADADDVTPSDDESLPAECEMLSGDEEVAAQAVSSPPPRRQSSKPTQAPACTQSVSPPQSSASCVSEPAQAPAPRVPESAQAPSSVSASKSKPAEPLMMQLKACAAKDSLLADEIKRRGHVLSEDLLRRMPPELPVGSVDYIHRLVDLIDEVIDGEMDANVSPDDSSSESVKRWGDEGVVAQGEPPPSPLRSSSVVAADGDDDPADVAADDDLTDNDSSTCLSIFKLFVDKNPRLQGVYKDCWHIITEELLESIPHEFPTRPFFKSLHKSIQERLDCS